MKRKKVWTSSFTGIRMVRIFSMIDMVQLVSKKVLAYNLNDHCDVALVMKLAGNHLHEEDNPTAS